MNLKVLPPNRNCLVCGKYVPDHDPKHTQGTSPSFVQVMDDPCYCSDECWEKDYKQIKKKGD